MRWFLVGLVLVTACSSGQSVPEANKALRQVSLISTADLEAYEIAEAANDLLQVWCDDAQLVREGGEELAPEDPLLDGRSAAEIERIGSEAVELAESPELITVLRELSLAQAERVAILARPGKFALKKHNHAARTAVELGFGLRRWRKQR